MPRTFETTADEGVIRLPSDAPPSAHCVVTVLDGDLAELREQAAYEFPNTIQRRMGELLAKNRDETLTDSERCELNQLSSEYDQATLARARAMAELARLADVNSIS